MIIILNRTQVLFFILILPMYLVHPFMIFGLLIIGALSQLNLFILSKWLSSPYAPKGYEGFRDVFGEGKLRFLVLLCLIQLFIKTVILIVSYAETVRYFIFPAINLNWLVLFIVLIGAYAASKGMENTMRFAIIAFLSSFWIVFLFIRFYIPPIASLNDLYPLIPFEWTKKSWQTLLVTWSAFSGPEYLICLAPWFKKQERVIKYLSIGNAISILEYLFLFAASLFFYGSSYLRETIFPVINMLRYLESPILERVDTFLLSAHMFLRFCHRHLFTLFIRRRPDRDQKSLETGYPQRVYFQLSLGVGRIAHIKHMVLGKWRTKGDVVYPGGYAGSRYICACSFTASGSR
ncbi:GerAB/ArcD/ProY family transporter [Bacillus sonorensis]|uniref:GerAB/ArcD/ProY family transporter n=1 Tax=Bacillus sonorensis TaxID=119858 RepID=UPI00211854EC|nr:GerAB/ArcD/ProY family transporter [Bacillus sonorensis]